MALPKNHQPISTALLAQLASEVGHGDTDTGPTLPITSVENACRLLDWCVPASEWVGIPVPDIRWLIPTVLKSGGITLCSGQSKYALKTTFCLEMALSVTTGKSFAGIEPIIGDVVYVLEEGDAGEVQEHLKALAVGMRTEVPANLYMCYLPGLRLTTEHSKNALIATIKEKRPSLLVLDNLSYMVGGDENSHENVALAAETVRHLQKVAINEELALSIVVVGHLKKSARKGEPHAEQVRGSTVWRDLYDTHIALRQYSDKSIKGSPWSILHVTFRGSSASEPRRAQWAIEETTSGRWESAYVRLLESNTK